MLTSEEVREIETIMDDPARRWKMSPGEAITYIEALLEDRAELQAEIERLRAVVDMCREYIGTGNATADYEFAAERFRRDTHMMAPGKSEPPGFVSRYTYEQRQMAWEAWIGKQKEDVILALAALEAVHD